MIIIKVKKLVENNLGKGWLSNDSQSGVYLKFKTVIMLLINIKHKKHIENFI